MEFTRNNTTLVEVNDYERMYKKPAFFFLGFLAIIGMVGNLFVLYIYGFQMKKKKVQHFITLLAVFDILCCLIALPLKMLELWMPMTYPSSALCKIQNAVICFTCVASASTLLVISIDRYRKVCRPTKPQMRLNHVQILFGVITFVSLAFAVTAVFVYDRISQPLSTDEDIYICSMHSEWLVTHIYFIALLLVTVIVLVCLLIFYCLIWRTARKHLSEFPVRYESGLNRCNSQMTQQKKPQKTNTNQILISISLLFVVSFVPSLILSIIFQNLYGKKIPFTAKVAIELGYAMWGLNSSMNPIIYGFCNRNFIIHVRNIFTKCGVSQTKIMSGVTSGDTSGTM